MHETGYPLIPDNSKKPLLFPDPVIEAFLKDVDRSLIRSMLQRTPSERLQCLINATAWTTELRRSQGVNRRFNRDVKLPDERHAPGPDTD